MVLLATTTDNTFFGGGATSSLDEPGRARNHAEAQRYMPWPLSASARAPAPRSRHVGLILLNCRRGRGRAPQATLRGNRTGGAPIYGSAELHGPAGGDATTRAL